jgi:hypothetical protein
VSGVGSRKARGLNRPRASKSVLRATLLALVALLLCGLGAWMLVHHADPAASIRHVPCGDGRPASLTRSSPLSVTGCPWWSDRSSSCRPCPAARGDGQGGMGLSALVTARDRVADEPRGGSSRRRLTILAMSAGGWLGLSRDPVAYSHLLQPWEHPVRCASCLRRWHLPSLLTQATPPWWAHPAGCAQRGLAIVRIPAAGWRPVGRIYNGSGGSG